ncbi:MAG TPA: TetR family transcriptional regulator [Paracoccaceae bacterium]|nr:TetR family transcriptional regulator [Paracoccaceae bacterium]
MSTDRQTRADAARATADRLIAVARAAFAEQGFAAVSLDALAAQAGMTRGALHHHFGNKAGLFEAVLRRIDAEIGTELEGISAAEPDPWTAFRQCYHHYLDAALAPDRRRILFQDAPAVLGLKAVEIQLESGFAEIVADLRALMAGGALPDLDPEALAHLLNGATVQLAFWAAAASGRLQPAHATLAALFDGLAASGAGAARRLDAPRGPGGAGGAKGLEQGA